MMMSQLQRKECITLASANALDPKHVQEVMIFVAKVLYNLSWDSSNRKRMLKEGPIPILIDSLRKYVDIGDHKTSPAQDLLTTLLYMSFTTCVPLIEHTNTSTFVHEFVPKNVSVTPPNACLREFAKREIVNNGLVEFLAAFLDDTTCEQVSAFSLVEWRVTRVSAWALFYSFMGVHDTDANDHAGDDPWPVRVPRKRGAFGLRATNAEENGSPGPLRQHRDASMWS